MPGRLVDCGPFELDPVAQTLRRDGETIALGSKATLLLAALFRRPGEVLTKSELMDAGWGQLAVEESNLTVQVATLRKTLGTAPGGGDWIVTVPRVGYRFAVSGTAPAEPPTNPSIAVLPFANLSADPDQAYFADGLAEEIITALSKLAGISVIARKSSFAYRDTDADIRKIASELGAKYVLEGTVRRSGEHLRMTVQLCEGATGSHLWAERYDSPLADVFAIQDEVTQRVVSSLKVHLTPQEAGRAAGGTTNVRALDLVLRARGLAYGTTQSPAIFDRIVDLASHAIAEDPGYADAYCTLSLAHLLNYINDWTADAAHSIVVAQELCTKAVEIAPNSAAAHGALGRILRHRKDDDSFIREFEIALELDPNHDEADTARGVIALSRDDPLAAVPHFEHAMTVDPSLSATTFHLQMLGIAYLFGGSYETAAALFRERILLVPDTDWSRGFLIVALGQLGQIEEARRVHAELMAVNPRYDLRQRLERQPAHPTPRQLEMVFDGWRKAGLEP